jgi:NHL repeat
MKKKSISANTTENIYKGPGAAMIKKMRTVNFLSAFLLLAGIVFMVSCRKSDLASLDTPRLSSVASLSGTNLLETGSLGTLRVLTLAGNGTAGLANAKGTAAQFNNPSGTAVDAAGNVYIADKANHVIRKMTPSGIVTTLAGSGTPGYVNALGSAAQFNNPSGVAVDASGNVYVADRSNHIIRKITADGLVSTLAGTPGTPGATNGPGIAAQFREPSGVAVDELSMSPIFLTIASAKSNNKQTAG